MTRLADILLSKRAEVETLRACPRTPSNRAPIDVLRRLRRSPKDPLRLIAEVKLRSPSAGVLSRTLAPEDRAFAYSEAGASMVSVLCDGPFFDGSFEHVARTRRRLDGSGSVVPILAKEFIVDARQVAEARDRGADAVLLIARIVDGGTFETLVRTARDEGVEPLAEVVDERELDMVMAANVALVGVNARDLDTLEMDTHRAARVLAIIPRDVVAIHMSGVRTRIDVASIAAGRADAALVGEVLMRRDDPRPLLADLASAAGAPRSALWVDRFGR